MKGQTSLGKERGRRAFHPNAPAERGEFEKRWCDQEGQRRPKEPCEGSEKRWKTAHLDIGLNARGLARTRKPIEHGGHSSVLISPGSGPMTPDYLSIAPQPISPLKPKFLEKHIHLSYHLSN